MRAKIVFHDGSWIVGRRVSWWEIFKSHMPETQGTHHWWIEDMSDEFVGVARECIGERVAVSINSMKYCVFIKEIKEDVANPSEIKALVILRSGVVACECYLKVINVHPSVVIEYKGVLYTIAPTDVVNYRDEATGKIMRYAILIVGKGFINLAKEMA